MSVEHFAANQVEFVDCGKHVVLHSIFGVDDIRDRLLSRLASEPMRFQTLVERGYGPDRERAVADLLLERALALAADATVLTSMFAPPHLQANVAVASRAASPDAIALLDELMA
jgi:hypothetical protein